MASASEIIIFYFAMIFVLWISIRTMVMGIQIIRIGFVKANIYVKIDTAVEKKYGYILVSGTALMSIYGFGILIHLTIVLLTGGFGVITLK